MKPTGASGWGGGTGAKQSLVLLDIHFFYFVFFRFLYPLSKGWFCHIYTFFLLLSTASRERLVQSYIHIPLLISTGSKQRLVQSYILFFFCFLQLLSKGWFGHIFSSLSSAFNGGRIAQRVSVGPKGQAQY